MPYDYFIAESVTYGNCTEMLAALISMKRNELLHYNKTTHFFKQLKVTEIKHTLRIKTILVSGMPVILFQCPIPTAGCYCVFDCYYQQTMGGFLSTFAFLEKKREQIQEKALEIPS